MPMTVYDFKHHLDAKVGEVTIEELTAFREYLNQFSTKSLLTRLQCMDEHERTRSAKAERLLIRHIIFSRTPI